VILLLAAASIVWQPLPPEGGEAPPPARGTARRRWTELAFFGLGLYSGFVQAGVGFLFTALLSAQGLDLVRSNGVKNAIVLSYSAMALGLFMFTGLLDWPAGLTLALGQYFGSRAGVRLQVLKGQAWVRVVFLLAIVGFSIQLVFGR
jgi:uncharacterized membrane protein YfcA